MELFVKVHARSVKIEHPRRPSAFAAGAIVFHAITEIDSHAITILAEPQTEIDVGLALPVPRIEAADRAERFHVHEGAARVRGLDFNDPMLRRWLRRSALKLLPNPESLIPRGEEERRHQWLFVSALRHALKTDLPEVCPRPIILPKFGVAAGKISRLKKNVGVGEQRVLRPDFAQGKIGSLAKSEGAFISDHADWRAQRWSGVMLRGSIVDHNDLLNLAKVRLERPKHLRGNLRVVVRGRGERQVLESGQTRASA